MSENQNTQFGNGYDSVSGVETITGKRKGKKAAVIGGITAVAVAGGCASAYAFSDTVKNQVKLRTMKPEKYYAWICENNASEIAKKASADYEKSAQKIKNGMGINYNIGFEVSDALKEQAKSMADGDEELLSLIENAKSINLDFNGTMGNAGMNYNIGALFNNDKLFTVDYAIDPKTMNISFRCPELAEKWMVIDASSMAEEIIYDENAQKLLDFYGDFIEDPESIITAQQVEDEINKYVGVWNNTTKDVTIEKKETIDIADIQADYTVAEVPVTADMAKEMASNVINELKNDDIAKGIIVDRLGVDANEFASGLEDALTEISESEGGDDTVTFKTYIDPTGQIRGVSVADSDGEEFKAVIGKDGDQIRGEFSFGEDEAVAVLTATESSDKAYTGKIDVTSEGETITFDFDGIKVVNEELGYAEGTITVNIPDTDPLTLVLASDGKSQNMSMDIKVEGTDYGKFTLGFSTTDGGNVTLPDKSNALVLNEDSLSSFTLSDYVAQEDFEKFCADILTKLGFKDVEDKAKMMADGAYGTGSSYEYDDFDEEDFEDDFDEEDFDEEDFNFEEFEDIEEDEEPATTTSNDSSASSSGSGFSFNEEDFKIDIPEVEIPSININQ